MARKKQNLMWHLEHVEGVEEVLGITLITG